MGTVTGYSDAIGTSSLKEARTSPECLKVTSKYAFMSRDSLSPFVLHSGGDRRCGSLEVRTAVEGPVGTSRGGTGVSGFVQWSSKNGDRECEVEGP